MTEQDIRALVMAKCAIIGESGQSRQLTVQIYNADAPLARGYAVKVTDALCASFVTAVFSSLGMTKYTDCIGKECGANRLANIYAGFGREISRDEAQAGDIAWFDGHIGFFAGAKSKYYDYWYDMQGTGAKKRTYKTNSGFRYYAPDYTTIAGYMGIGTVTPIEEFAAGDTVKLKEGAVYYTGVTIPAKYFSREFTISHINGKRAVLKEINSPVSTDYLSKIVEEKEETVETVEKISVTIEFETEVYNKLSSLAESKDCTISEIIKSLI